MEGDAVNVTLVPEQIAPEGLAAIFTPATPPASTNIVIVLEVAGDPVTQPELLVIKQDIISPFATDDDA